MCRDRAPLMVAYRHSRVLSSYSKLQKIKRRPLGFNSMPSLHFQGGGVTKPLDLRFCKTNAPVLLTDTAEGDILAYNAQVR